MIRDLLVFSTYVEVIPTGFRESDSTVCILHVCGGDPDANYVNLADCLGTKNYWEVREELLKYGFNK